MGITSRSWGTVGVAVVGRGVSGPARRLLIAGAAALLWTACIGRSGGQGILVPEPESFEVRVTVTNPGNGSGTVAISFSAGEVSDECPVLGPGESCTRTATHTSRITGVALDADPAPGSRFVTYAGACSASADDPECELDVPGETTVELNVDAVFDTEVSGGPTGGGGP